MFPIILIGLLTGSVQSDEYPEIDGDIHQRAKELHEQAMEAEPWITPILLFLADEFEGEMSGLEFRFKSAESLSRKIETKMVESGEVDPADISIRDALRYTMLMDDLPAGSHDANIAELISLFENVGHEILTVKNYWQRGDEYSGVNTTFRAPNGLSWELQFHTAESFELKMRSHQRYEETRLQDATPEQRRLMFDEVSAEWDRIEIPVGILEPGSLHEIEQIILRPKP